MFVFYVANRYIRSKRSRNLIMIINYVTGVVILVAAAAMTIVLSGFGGLKDISLKMIDAFEPDLKIEAKHGKTFITTPLQLEKLGQLSGVQAYSQVVEERVLLSFKDKKHIASIKGVDSNYPRINNMENIIYSGFWKVDEYRVVIGGGISDILGIGILNEEHFLKIFVPKYGNKSFSGNDYSQIYTTVSGVYRVNIDVDKKYVFIDIDHARELLKFKPNEVSAITLKLASEANEHQLKQQIAAIFGNNVEVFNRIETNDTLYKMLNTENIAIYLIFTLIIIIALFNLVGSTIILILDKKKDIKTLYCMGLTMPRLRMIFFVQGLLITCIFSSLGILIGLIFCWIQIKYGFIYITPVQPYPMKISVVDCLSVFVLIVFLGAAASKMASHRVTEKLLF